MANLPLEILQNVVLQFGRTSLDRYVTADKDDPAKEHRVKRHRAKRHRMERLTLCNLSLTCKALHKVARVALYKVLDFSSRDLTTPTLPFVLSTMIEQPSLCHLVREVDVTGWATEKGPGYFFACYRFGEYEVDRATLEICARGAEGLSLSTQLCGKIRDKLLERDKEAAIALLLGICTNIRRLEFATSNGFEYTLCNELLTETWTPHEVGQTKSTGKVVASKPGQSISELGLSIEIAVTHHQSLKSLSTFLRLPALEHISGRNVSCAIGHPELPTMQSSIRQCTLVCSYVDAEGLQQLLSVCPSLRVLSLNLRVDITYAEEFPLGAFGRVLQQHGPMLNSLLLHDDKAGPYLTNDGEPLGDLSRMRSLKELDVTYRALFGGGNGNSDDDDTDDSDNSDGYFHLNNVAANETLDRNYLTNTLPQTL